MRKWLTLQQERSVAWNLLDVVDASRCITNAGRNTTYTT